MLLIILGAGASYDYHPDPSADWIMPMTNGLIDDTLHNSGNAKNAWPGAIPILKRLKEIEKQDKNNFNLEETLFAELARNDENVNAQLLSFLFYVHHIISSSESLIRRDGYADTNYTNLLAKLQRSKIDTKIGIRIVSFNYDTLIEAACNQLYPIWNFNTYQDYLSGPNKIKLYKPHGSLNWQKLTTNIDHQPRVESVIKLLVGTYRNHSTTERIINYDEVYQSHTSASTPLMQPILALPYKDKTSFVFPDNHKASLISDINRITHILTIGWRGSEAHFHQQILSKIPPKNRIKVLNVNKGSEEVSRQLTATLSHRITSQETFTEGFSNFLANDNVLEKFLVE